MIGLQNLLIVLFLAFENVYLFESITEDMTNDINLLNLLFSNILNLEKILRQKKQSDAQLVKQHKLFGFSHAFFLTVKLDSNNKLSS